MLNNLSSNKWFYLIVLSIIWGSSYILIKIGLESFGYIEAATIRLTAAGIICFPLATRYLKNIQPKKLSLIILSSLLSMFVPAYLLCFSQQHVQSSVAGILIAMTPSFTFIFSFFFFKKKYTATQLTGLIMGFACAFILSTISGAGNFSINIYVMLIILVTVCYGLNINIVKHYLADIPSLQLSALTVSINGLLAFVFFFLPNINDYQFATASLSSLWALLTLGIFATALAQFINYKLITISSPLFASAITYVIPIVAVLWGILDNERLTIMHCVIITGILISVYLIRKEK